METAPGIRSWLARALSAQLLRYGAVGVLNTAFSFGSYSLLVYLGMPLPLASLVALVAGIGFSFMTQGFVVFRNATPATFVRFVVAWTAIYVLNVAIIKALVAQGLNPYAAGAAATPPVVAVSYLVLKHLVFRKAVGP